MFGFLIRGAGVVSGVGLVVEDEESSRGDESCETGGLLVDGGAGVFWGCNGVDLGRRE